MKRVRADGGKNIAADERAELKRTAKARHSADGKEWKSREQRNGYGY